VRTSHIRFSFLLPLGELLIWLILVPVPATLLYLSLQSQFHSADQVVFGSMRMSYTEARRIACQGPALRASHFIAALNTPAFLIEFLISIPISWPSSWHPEGMTPDVWRALSFPFFALPAWWFAGRSIDACLLRQRPNWAITVIAILFSTLFVILFCGLRFGLSTPERDGVTFPLWGFPLWAALFAVYPAAWIRSRRRRTELLHAE
jgi:hypothetical protein